MKGLHAVRGLMRMRIPRGKEVRVAPRALQFEGCCATGIRARRGLVESSIKGLR